MMFWITKSTFSDGMGKCAEDVVFLSKSKGVKQPFVGNSDGNEI
jgi:hypothetical protein